MIQVSMQNIIIHIYVSTTTYYMMEVTMEKDEQETNTCCSVTDLIGIRNQNRHRKVVEDLENSYLKVWGN